MATTVPPARPGHRHGYGDYPYNWPAIAQKIKERAKWRCQACNAPHGKPPHVLTVDHLDYNKANCRPTNLLALCQRCHLRRQGLYPAVLTKAEALRRLKLHEANLKAQLRFDL